MTRLTVTGQIQRGDHIVVSYRNGSSALMFCRETVAQASWKVAQPAAA